MHSSRFFTEKCFSALSELMSVDILPIATLTLSLSNGVIWGISHTVWYVYKDISVLDHSNTARVPYVCSVTNHTSHALSHKHGITYPPPTSLSSSPSSLSSNKQIRSSTVHVQEGGVHLAVTVVDTPGFGDIVDNSQW